MFASIQLLRSQLQHLKGFLFTCKDPIAEDVRRRIWPREYLWDDIHQYSLLVSKQALTVNLIFLSFFLLHSWKGGTSLPKMLVFSTFVENMQAKLLYKLKRGHWLYSCVLLQDLIQVQSGQMAHHLKKIIAHCTKHVYKCKVSKLCFPVLVLSILVKFEPVNDY